MDLGTLVGNTNTIDLMDLPDVHTLSEWQMHTIRVVAQAPPACEVRDAQIWIMQAFDPKVPREDLRESGKFARLDMMIATSMNEKFAKLKRSRNLTPQQSHFLSQMTRMDLAAIREHRMLKGREMIRAVCYWCSVRSELGQHRICRDIFKIVIDPHKPDADLYYFYDEWMKVYLELYGVRPPSDEMRASIHAHFLEQCRKPSKLEQVIGFLRHV